jgi:hypothetical protein
VSGLLSAPTLPQQLPGRPDEALCFLAKRGLATRHEVAATVQRLGLGIGFRGSSNPAVLKEGAGAVVWRCSEAAAASSEPRAVVTRKEDVSSCVGAAGPGEWGGARATGVNTICHFSDSLTIHHVGVGPTCQR